MRSYRLPCAALAGCLFLAACSGHPVAPPENPSATESSDARTFTPEELRADLTHLYSTLQEAHFDLFVHASKADYDALFAKTLASLDEPLSLFEAQTRFQEFMAFGRVGHARIDFPHEWFEAYRSAGGKTVPFYFRVVDGRALVTEDYSGHGELETGDEVVALEGEPMAAWLRRLRGHISAEAPYMAHALLEFWFPRLLWLELGEVDRFELEVRKPGENAPRSIVIEARTQEEIRQAAEASPATLELDWNGREARMLDDGIAYLRPGPFYDPEAPDTYDPTAFGQWIDQAIEDFLAADATDLLIDLRDNPGGDNSFSDLMVAWFADRPFRFHSAFRVKVSPQTTASNQRRLDQDPDTDGMSRRYAELYRQHRDGEVIDVEMPYAEPRKGKRFEGDVYVLVNRHSFSNAVNVAALVQDYGFGTILGEPTSDLATTYGAMEHFELPHTGLRVGYPKAHIVRPNEDERFLGVVPDITIETPLVQGPEDPVLRRAREIITDIDRP